MAGYTEKQRDALKRAIASGALTVDSPDTGRVTYRSLDEMQRALSTIERGLAADAAAGGAGPRRTRQVVMTGRSGF